MKHAGLKLSKHKDVTYRVHHHATEVRAEKRKLMKACVRYSLFKSFHSGWRLKYTTV